MNSIGWYQNSNNEWDIDFENGVIKTDLNLNVVVKHIVLCNGRVSNSLQRIRQNRGGFVGDIFNGNLSFSTAWFYYLQNVYTNNVRIQLKNAILNALLQNSIIQNLQNQGNVVNVNVNLITNKNIEIFVYLGKQVISFNL